MTLMCVLDRNVASLTLLTLLLVSHCCAQTPQNTGGEPDSDWAGGQLIKDLSLRVVDPDKNPVADAKVTPWALRSSQGHGLWRSDDRSDVTPELVSTNAEGVATVRYPYFRDLEERIRTTAVSVYVDHPRYAFPDAVHIDVPLEGTSPFTVELTRGVPLEVRPTIDGQPTDLENVFAMWSDGRSWQPGASVEKTADRMLRFPAMNPDINSLLLVRIDGDTATHFSKLTDIDLSSGDPATISLELHPARRVDGALSNNVPRPVRAGRVKLRTLQPANADPDRVGWHGWAPIRDDGTFTIEAWPAGEAMQVIALSDGFIATSGKAPPEVTDPRDPAQDPFYRPQVFRPTEGDAIEVAMTRLVDCVVTAVDETDRPVVGVEVLSGPNVGWWNDGSQIYCHYLVRGETVLRRRGYRESNDESYAPPFRGKTGDQGTVVLQLPAGRQRLFAVNDEYELPIFLGGRDVRVELKLGQTTEVTLRLQAKGTEQLGEWDKLAGVVFGCSTREGRRICALPEVQAKMAEFTNRFRDAANQRDPTLLSEAYTLVAEAFAKSGDFDESIKWAQKAAEQKAKMPSRSDATEQAPPASAP